MKIERSTVTKLTIDDLMSTHRLDPVTVYAEDLGPRRGKIIIECYGKSWSASWGGIGERTITEFFHSCSVDYLAKNLSDISADITDSEVIKDSAKRAIFEQRRGRYIRSFRDPEKMVRIKRNEITADEARELYDEVDDTHFSDDGWGDAKLMEKVFGEEWWYRLPTKPNPDYQYLCRIIEAVQQALYMESSVKAAA